MSALSPVLSPYEVTQLESMLSRIKGQRPTENSAQRQLHYAVEDAISAVAMLGRGVTSTALSFEEVGRDVRKIVENGR